MKFKSIEIEGFRTWHKAIFNLDRPGLTQIAGKNGCGKSSLIEALVWCLYGETLRNGTNIATKKTERPINWTGTMVSVFIELADGKSLRVTRYHESTKTGMTGHKSALVVEVDGEQIQTVNKKDTQETLIQLLGLSFTAFSRAVVLPQRALSLLNAKPEHQREALDALFDLTWLTEGKAKALADVQKYTSKIQEISGYISTLQIQINAIDSEIQVANLRNQNVIANRDNKIQSLINTIKNLNEGLESIALKEVPNYNQEEIDALSKKLSEEQTRVLYIKQQQQENDTLQREASKQISNINTEIGINRAKDEIASRKLTVKSICETCGQPIDPNKLENVINATNAEILGLKLGYGNLKILLEESKDYRKVLELEADRLLTELYNIESSILALEKRLSEYNNIKRNAQAALEYNLGFNDYITSIKNQILDCENQLRELKNTTLILENTEHLERELEQHKQLLIIEQQNLQANKGLYEIASWWSVTGFGGRGGLRQYVVNQMLVAANEQIKKYSGSLGLTLNIMYDKTNIKVMVTDINGIETSFEDLSGGEQQRLELMLILTLHDIVNANSGVDLLFLDEPNTNVDDDGVFEVFEILRQKKGTIFIITHTAVDGVGMSVVPIEKIGSQSKILI